MILYFAISLFSSRLAHNTKLVTEPLKNSKLFDSLRRVLWWNQKLSNIFKSFWNSRCSQFENPQERSLSKWCFLRTLANRKARLFADDLIILVEALGLTVLDIFWLDLGNRKLQRNSSCLVSFGDHSSRKAF